jgi:ABC-type nitrate/sulfonate/bicarbonate transport system permease component
MIAGLPVGSALSHAHVAALPPHSTRWRWADGKCRAALRVAAVAGALALWQILVGTQAISSAAVAAPLSIGREFGPLLATSAFWTSAASTVSSWAIGLAISLAIAVPVGLLLGASNLAYRMSRTTIDFLRTIPPVALIPLALLLYGATPTMALVLIVFGSVWPVLLQSMYGVHQVSAGMLDVARSYQLRWRDRVMSVILPSAAPFVATGVRIAATMSLLLAIGAELVGGAPGIGSSIALAEQASNAPKVYALVVVSAVLGLALNVAMIELERRLLGWHAAQRNTSAR